MKAHAEEKNHEYVDQLERIQCILQDISSLLATPLNLKLSGTFAVNGSIFKYVYFVLYFYHMACYCTMGS